MTGTKLRLASLSLVAALSVCSTRAFAQPKEEIAITDNARQHFKTGVAYLQDPDGARYDEAYREFKAAYADSPSWKILGNLGISAMKLERDGEAVEAFEKYLEGAGDQIDPSEKAQMEKDLATTKANLAWISVDVVPEGALIVDERVPVAGKAVENRYALEAGGKLRVGIRGGHHKVVARLAGYEDQVWELDVKPGTEETRSFKLEKPKVAPQVVQKAEIPMERPVPAGVIIGAVGTGVLLAGAGVVGYLAMSKNQEYKDKNDGLHLSEARDLSDSGKTLNLVADIMLGGAVVAGVITTIVFLGRPEVPANGAPAKDTAKLRFAPGVGKSSAGLFVTGQF